jgi:PST family polysaccharide transporter
MSFARILRSSALMGATSVFTMLAALLRGKAVAFWLGANGIGMMGWLNQSITLLTQVAGIGLPTTSVKAVAQAEPSEVVEQESAVARLALWSAGIGFLASLVISWPLVWITFGNIDQIIPMVLCTFAVPLGIISGAWTGVIQARGDTRRLAIAQVLSAIAGLVSVGAGVFWLGLLGLAGGLALAALWPIILFWRSRPRIVGRLFETDESISKLLRAGMALMAALTVAQCAAYATRVLIVRYLGLADAGYYQAAFAISSSLPAFVFAAMSTEYYPRIAAAKTGEEVGKAVNMQIQAGVVMALPILMGIMLFSEQLLVWLYTDDFVAAKAILTYLTLAVAIRLISWPVGYWLLGHAKHTDYFLIEGLNAFLVPMAAWILIPKFGMTGLGYATCLGAIAYTAIIIIHLKAKAGASLSNITWGFVFIAGAAIMFATILSTTSISQPVRMLVLIFAAIFATSTYRRMARAHA